jgi:hypothetical protein
MPQKKTGQRKKAEKQKLRQKQIRSAAEIRGLADAPCNVAMVSLINNVALHHPSPCCKLSM